MKYETAKKLMDVGFPQIGTGGYAISTHEVLNNELKEMGISIYCAKYNIPYLPTLEDLLTEFPVRTKYRIEGLINDAFLELNKIFINGGEPGYMAVLAGDFETTEHQNEWRFIDEDPREAVALLLIKLKQK